MLRTVLLDDEKPALKALEHLLKQYPEIEIVGMFTDAEQALALVKSGNVDVVFLDIDMPNLNGIAAAKEIFSYDMNVEIIFVTAYSHFAVEAFELNVMDYIMKPVSPQRLDTTIERLMQQYFKVDIFEKQQNKNEFFNDLITEKITSPEEILQKAKLLNIDFTQSFSLFFLLVYDIENQSIQESVEGKDSQLSGCIEVLSVKDNLVVWQTRHGIGIIDYAISADGCKNEEMEAATKIKEIAATIFTDKAIAVGIANRYKKIERFSDRYVQARNAAIIGARVSPNLEVYHVLDSGFLPVLNQYIDKKRAEALIDSTIGKLIEHDRVTGADLFHTMEMIILNHSFQEVANILFIHYKTVLFRKQAIEKILGISMNSFAGRTMLGLALTLFYLRDIDDIHHQ